MKPIGSRKALRSYSLNDQKYLLKTANKENEQPRKKTLYSKVKPDAEKIMNESCLAQKYFRFSVQSKFKNNIGESSSHLKETKCASQWVRRGRKMNLSLCCFHKNKCPHSDTSKLSFSFSHAKWREA